MHKPMLREKSFCISDQPWCSQSSYIDDQLLCTENPSCIDQLDNHINNDMSVWGELHQSEGRDFLLLDSDTWDCYLPSLLYSIGDQMVPDDSKFTECRETGTSTTNQQTGVVRHDGYTSAYNQQIGCQISEASTIQVVLKYLPNNYTNVSHCFEESTVEPINIRTYLHSLPEDSVSAVNCLQNMTDDSVTFMNHSNNSPEASISALTCSQNLSDDSASVVNCSQNLPGYSASFNCAQTLRQDAVSFVNCSQNDTGCVPDRHVNSYNISTQDVIEEVSLPSNLPQRLSQNQVVNDSQISIYYDNDSQQSTLSDERNSQQSTQSDECDSQQSSQSDERTMNSCYGHDQLVPNPSIEE